MIYREAGAGRMDLLRQAAPPRRRNTIAWLTVTLVLAMAFVVELSSFGVGAALLGGLALSGGWMTQHVRAYNSTDFPDLMKRWQQSVMCNRCGHVFVQSELSS